MIISSKGVLFCYSNYISSIQKYLLYDVILNAFHQLYQVNIPTDTV